LSLSTEFERDCARRVRVFNLPQRKSELEELEIQAESQGLWDDPARAQSVMQKLSAVRAYVLPFDTLDKRAADLMELIEMANMEGDPSMAEEIEKEIPAFESDYRDFERTLLFAGEYDATNAIFSVNAGAGGTEAQDWAKMLVRAYTRWFARHGFDLEVIEETPGDEAGLKGFSAIVKGVNAYGHCKAEAGVHRLVRISPFNSQGKRMTSFASVDVVPEISDDIQIEINPKDLRIDTYLSGGAGGQNVQKNETAIRITHIPSGIVTQCQNERSQLQNREVAMKVLKSKLFEIEWRKRQEHIASLRGEVKSNEWGSQIRSYVFQPYQLVKDLRSGYETSDISGVMDGDFDGLVYAYLEYLVGQES
jgi:peptide chain release factor 2